MKPRIDPGLRDFLGLSLLAAGGCGLALSQGDLLFVAIFGGACAVIAPRQAPRPALDGRWKLMIALFVWLFQGPWLAFERAVDVEDSPV
jgi:hypothetical protein